MLSSAIKRMSLKSAFRSKKQRPDWATAVENLRRALNGLTQAELAKSVGVSAPIVSQWESGTRKPSPSVFVRMANIAPDPLCFQFWDFADIHAATLLRLAPDIEKRIRAAVSSESGIVRVPLLRDLNQILTPGIPVAEEIESWIPLPANEVPNPASTSCVLLPQGHGFSVFSERARLCDC
jgi:transcriptional regulator with XRE-family HTH domain